MIKRELSEIDKIYAFANELKSTIGEIALCEQLIEDIDKMSEDDKYILTLTPYKHKGESFKILINKNFVLRLKSEMQNELDMEKNKLEELKKHLIL